MNFDHIPTCPNCPYCVLDTTTDEKPVNETICTKCGTIVKITRKVTYETSEVKREQNRNANDSSNPNFA